MSSYHNCYAASGTSENALVALKHNQLQYYFSDVEVRGEIPSYMYRFYEEKGFNIEITDQDREDLKETVDFVSFSFYGTSNIDASGKEQRNICGEANAWGWTMDPVGLRVALNEYYDRYQKPLIVAENGMGFHEKLDESGQLHDPYRIDFYRSHIKQVKEAIYDGVEIWGYYPWGPIDIVSCSSSEMEKRYGFIYVDYDNYHNGTGKRILKDSYAWYKKAVESNGEDLK